MTHFFFIPEIEIFFFLEDIFFKQKTNIFPIVRQYGDTFLFIISFFQPLKQIHFSQQNCNVFLITTFFQPKMVMFSLEYNTFFKGKIK